MRSTWMMVNPNSIPAANTGCGEASHERAAQEQFTQIHGVADKAVRATCHQAAIGQPIRTRMTAMKGRK
jgi:hypothetical protein